MSTYRRVQHAAHYSGHPLTGHDLEQWTAPAAACGETYPPSRPADVPVDATYSHGYLAPDGSQHWVFSRTAPLSGDACVRCRGAVK